jgi:hypothetical protein
MLGTANPILDKIVVTFHKYLIKDDGARISGEVINDCCYESAYFMGEGLPDLSLDVNRSKP